MESNPPKSSIVWVWIGIFKSNLPIVGRWLFAICSWITFAYWGWNAFCGWQC